jgi:hypothetical protein
VSWLDDDNLLITRSNTKFVYASKSELVALATYRVCTDELQVMEFRQPADRVLEYVAGVPMLRDVRGVMTLFVPGMYVQGAVLLETSIAFLKANNPPN